MRVVAATVILFTLIVTAGFTLTEIYDQKSVLAAKTAEAERTAADLEVANSRVAALQSALDQRDLALVDCSRPKLSCPKVPDQGTLNSCLAQQERLREDIEYEQKRRQWSYSTLNSVRDDLDQCKKDLSDCQGQICCACNQN